MSQADDVLKHRDDLFINVLNAQKTFNTSYPSLKEETKITFKSRVKNSKRSNFTNPIRRTQDEELIRFRRNQRGSLDILYKSFKNIDDSIKFVKTLSVLTLAGIGVVVAKLTDITVGVFRKDESYDSIDSSFSGLSTGKMSSAGIEQLKKDEGGFVSKAYWDKDGYSIGYGHHGLVDGKKIQKDQTITKEKADQLLLQDVEVAENTVKRQLKRNNITTPISQNMFDAMVNYAYNAGSLGPKFLEALKNGDYRTAMQELEVGEENKDRMARIRQTFGSDISEDNKLKSGASSINTYSSAQKRPLSYATGKQFGGYQLKNNEVKVTDYMADYLRQIKGTGVITSGSEINKWHRWRDNGTYTSKHVLGNKIDVRTNDTRNAYELAQRAIPFMEHPATIMVNFEYIKASVYKECLDIIKRERPDIAQRIGRDLRVINSNPSNSSGTQHLDIEIDPSRLSRPTEKIEDKKVDTSKKIVEKSSNVNEAQKNLKTAKPKKESMKTVDNKTNKNLFIKEKNEPKNQLKISNLIDFSDTRKATEEQEQKDRISSIV